MRVMKKEKKKFYVICHDIRSAFNVGAIFRTSDALGAAFGIAGYEMRWGLPRTFSRDNLTTKITKAAGAAETLHDF